MYRLITYIYNIIINMIFINENEDQNIIEPGNKKQKISEEYYFDKFFITILKGALNKNEYRITEMTETKIVIRFIQYKKTCCVINKQKFENSIIYVIKFISDIMDLNTERILDGHSFIFRGSVGDILDTIKSASEDLYYTYLEIYNKNKKMKEINTI